MRLLARKAFHDPGGVRRLDTRRRTYTVIWTRIGGPTTTRGVSSARARRAVGSRRPPSKRFGAPAPACDIVSRVTGAGVCAEELRARLDAREQRCQRNLEGVGNARQMSERRIAVPALSTWDRSVF